MCRRWLIVTIVFQTMDWAVFRLALPPSDFHPCLFLSTLDSILRRGYLLQTTEREKKEFDLTIRSLKTQYQLYKT